MAVCNVFTRLTADFSTMREFSIFHDTQEFSILTLNINFLLVLSESFNFFKVDLMLQQLLTSIQMNERAGKIYADGRGLKILNFLSKRQHNLITLRQT